MTREEFAKAMALLSAAIDKPIGKTTIAAWFEILKDLPGPAVEAAVHTVIATDEYPTLPSVGKIRNTAITLMEGQKMTAAEAWGLTLKAIKDYGHYREKEGLEALPEPAAETARIMGWRELCFAENIEVIRGQYIKIYENQKTARRDQQALPAAARALIQQAMPRAQITDSREGGESNGTEKGKNAADRFNSGAGGSGPGQAVSIRRDLDQGNR